MLTFIAVLGSITALVGAYALEYGKHWLKWSEVIHRKRCAQLIFAGSLIALIATTYSSISHEKEMRIRSDTTISEVQRTLQTLTGGSTYPHVEFQIDQNANLAYVALSSSGAYPLYDLTVRIRNKKDASIPTLSNPANGTTSLYVHSLVPKTTFMPGDITVPLSSVEDSMDFSIWIASRNGLFYQDMHLRRVNGQWKRYSRVFRAERPSEISVSGYTYTAPAIIAPNVVNTDDVPINTKLLYNRYDEGFPL